MADEPTARESIIDRLRAGATDGRTRATTSLTGWRRRSPVVDTLAAVAERDRSSLGTVVGSAVAMRLFLFVVPTVLFLVGVLGLVGRQIDPDEINEAAGVTSTLADQIASAMSQGGTAAWVAIIVGGTGMAFGGRALARVLAGGASLAWEVPFSPARSLRILGTVLLVSTAMLISSAVVNRIRLATGVAVSGMALVAVAAIYVVLWIVLMAMLPSGTPDPGATLPGATIVGGALALFQGATQLFIADRLAGASQLYGAIGASTVIVGWLFVVGRLAMIGLVVNAVVFERYGSVSRFVFGLPVLRAIPRRVPIIARWFDLPRGEC